MSVSSSEVFYADGEAVRLTGDGVVVPVVRWLAANLLEPLVAGTGVVGPS